MTGYQYHTLNDGRILSYMEYGPNDGCPVLYFHGSPTSGYEPLLIGETLFAYYKLRVIAPNRPGIGQSAFQKGRGFSHWPDDVLSLADYLGLGKFAVLGNSGGSAYVMACAAKIPGRLTAAVIVSGAWQMNLPLAKKHLKMPYSLFWAIAGKLPFLLPYMLGSMKRPQGKSTEKTAGKQEKMMPAADFEALKQNGRQANLSRSINEAVVDKKGAAWDVRLYVKPWDFDPGKINFPITFFHGGEDKNVPVELVKFMVPKVPGAKLIIYPDEAHLSTLCNRFGDIAQALLGK